ncbi:MAG TPA: hypothetical protein VMS95_06825 [Candidatus Krumholzibacteriaceae bacterium]|jgi:hypothetical protein|nr:hypothetical protein [Candidatus Krumholzibacteriaceae bacterium]
MVNSVLENEIFEEEMFRLSRRLLQVFHGLGLSCLAGAVFLQVLVFLDIGQKGYFFAVENNPLVLWTEVGFSGFTATYFGYMYLRFIRSLKR